MGKERARHGSSALLSVLYGYLWRDFHDWLNAWPHLSSLLFSSIYASLSDRANRRTSERAPRLNVHAGWKKQSTKAFLQIRNNSTRFQSTIIVDNLGGSAACEEGMKWNFSQACTQLNFGERERHFSTFHRLAPWVDYWASKLTHNWRELHTSDRLKGIRNENDVRWRRLMVGRE